MSDEENNEKAEEARTEHEKERAESKKAEAARTEHEKERAESKKAEAENPGSGGSSFFDEPASANAKDAGKADAQAERAQSDSDD